MEHICKTLAAAAAGAAMLGSGAAQAQDIRGLVRARHQAVISSEINARITDMPFEEGESFSKGDTLIKFDCSLLRAELRATQAALSAQRKRHKNNLELRKYDAVGKVEVEISAAETQRAGAEVSAASTRAGRCEISAPFSGRVVERRAQPFESVAPDQELVYIVDSSTLVVELIAPSEWLNWLAPGEKFRFAVDETREVHEAEVERLGAVVDAVSHTIKVYGRFNGKAARVLAGMSGAARFNLEGRGS